MKVLRKGILNNKKEVRFAQGWLNLFANQNLVVDGSFGTKSELATIAYQKSVGLPPTGRIDIPTQTKMGFRQTQNSKIVVLEIPFSKIEKADVLWTDGVGGSVKSHAQAGGFDICWNGALFENKTKEVCQLMVINGAVKHWGMRFKGIAYPTDLSAYPLNGLPKGIFGCHVDTISGKPYDMQGAAPCLIENYAFAKEEYNLGYRSVNGAGSTARNCTAVTDTSILLFFSIFGCTLMEMAKEGLYQRVKFMQNNDGGGSQSLYMDGSFILTTDGRTIPACIGLKIKQ